MKNALYTVTSGRSGTKFLAELLRHNLADSLVFHERTGFPHFGVNTPDASHATTFNHVGNVSHVQSFWAKKLQRDCGESQHWVVDVSHHLAKAGLIENLSVITPSHRVTIVLLRRDPFKVAWSYINRFDFVNNGFTWLFSLDSNYPRRIIDSAAFAKQGVFGKSIWYVNEVYARQAYYRRMLKEHDNIKVLDVTLEALSEVQGALAFLTELVGKHVEANKLILPKPQNRIAQVHFDHKVKADVQKLFHQLWIDPDAAGASFYEAGGRLG